MEARGPKNSCGWIGMQGNGFEGNPAIHFVHKALYHGNVSKIVRFKEDFVYPTDVFEVATEQLIPLV